MNPRTPPMKSLLLSTVVCAFLAFAAGAAPGKEDAKKAPPKPVNAKCPVMSEPIDPKVTTVHDKKLIAFCCESCIDDFKKEPAKYMKKVEQKKPAKKDGKDAK